MNPSAIELEIEELLLHGLPEHASAAVADALIRELTRLLTERGLPPKLSAPGAWEGIRGLELGPAETRTPEALGTNAARTIYEGMLR